MATYHGEVLGLQASGDGRSSLQNPCYGTVDASNDNIRFKITVSNAMNRCGGILEEAIKAVSIYNETELCTVGVISKATVVAEREKQRKTCRCVCTVDRYAWFINKQIMALKSERNTGIALF